MDEAITSILDKVYGHTMTEADAHKQLIQAFKEAGYVKLPGNAQNVTITTSDNPSDGKLMTEQEWREKFSV